MPTAQFAPHPGVVAPCVRLVVASHAANLIPLTGVVTRADSVGLTICFPPEIPNKTFFEAANEQSQKLADIEPCQMLEKFYRFNHRTNPLPQKKTCNRTVNGAFYKAYLFAVLARC